MITPETSRPPGVAQADAGAEGREGDRADQQAQDHADGQRQQVGAVLGAAKRPSSCAALATALLQAGHEQHVHALQLGARCRPGWAGRRARCA
jgi:hypothetical protein